MKIFLLVLCLWGCCLAQGIWMPLTSFASGGLKNSPAKVGAPSVFMSCEFLRGMEALGCGAGGEFLIHSKRIYFYSIYEQMDSLYRQVYSELDFSYGWKTLVLGGAYGYSMEWSPGLAKWSRHRYKGGVSLVFENAYVEAIMEGWMSDFEKTWEGALGAGVYLGNLGLAYGQWDGSGFFLGNRIAWKFLTVETSYQFPDFGVGFRVVFSLGKWEPSGSYGFSSGKWSWFGIGGVRKI